MAELEGEALLLGIWKNVEDLEASLSLAELEAITKAARDREYRNWKFQAGLKGYDLDAETGANQETETGEEALERIQRRAALKSRGISDGEIEEQIEKMEILDFGIDFIE